MKIIKKILIKSSIVLSFGCYTIAQEFTLPPLPALSSSEMNSSNACGANQNDIVNFIQNIRYINTLKNTLLSLQGDISYQQYMLLVNNNQINALKSQRAALVTQLDQKNATAQQVKSEISGKQNDIPNALYDLGSDIVDIKEAQPALVLWLQVVAGQKTYDQIRPQIAQLATEVQNDKTALNQLKNAGNVDALSKKVQSLASEISNYSIPSQLPDKPLPPLARQYLKAIEKAPKDIQDTFSAISENITDISQLTENLNNLNNDVALLLKQVGDIDTNLASLQTQSNNLNNQINQDLNNINTIKNQMESIASNIKIFPTDKFNSCPNFVVAALS